jgi:hypothetical protein
MRSGDWSGQTLLDLALRALFTVVGGDLIVDDTVVEKPDATCLAEAAWVWSSKPRQVVFGIPLVLLVWTDGQVRVPLAFRIWRRGGPSTFDLALELLSSARNRLRCRPESVRFDAWDPSKALLKRIRDYGWYFVCRLKKNRRFNGQPLRTFRRHPYWAEAGRLTGGLKVLVVRYGTKYYATNRLTLPATEVRRLYQVRAQIEEVIRVCKDQLGLSGCQARSERAQLHHLTCCLVAFCVLERERYDRNLTIYQLKRRLSYRGRTVGLPALERLREAA